MNDVTQNIFDTMRRAVWSGFYGPDEVHRIIDDILEDGADEPFLRATVQQEFDKKAAAETTWPTITECDRLDQAFQELDAHGIIALHNAGYTMSDGFSDIAEELHERGREGVEGYCFYHGQDLERAVDGERLLLAFGDLDDNKESKTRIGRAVAEAITRHGFTVHWNGDPEVRLEIDIDWKRRGPQ
jgi:hypothetical protein